MKQNTQNPAPPKRLSPAWVFFALLGMLLGATSIPAQVLTWDANGSTAPNPSDGSGTWSTAGDWWSGTANVNGNWTSTQPNSASFGAGTAGLYTISLANYTYATNLAFTASGYTLSGGTLTLQASSGNSITVSANVAATIACIFTNSYNPNYSVASGGKLTFTGGGSFGGNQTISGAGTVDFQSGTYVGNFNPWLQAAVTQEAATLNISRLMVGYSGNATYTINSPSAQVTGSGGGGNNFLGRGGYTGTLDLKQGTVTMTASGNEMRIGYDNSGNSKGILTVEGGTFNLGYTANNLYINYGGTAASDAGTLNLYGGTLTAKSVLLGQGTTAFASGSTATFNMTGGALYVGAGGLAINPTNTGTLNASIVLSGGTVGAMAPWSSGSPMTLTNINGNITFQAADSSGVAQNITLSNVLSGLVGGLTKTGNGTLSLLGTNTYAGPTTISSNSLALVGMASISNSSSINISAGGTLDVSGLISTTFNLSGKTALSASGTTTAANIKGAAGGIVSLGTSPITLTYDGADPALTISQGALSLSGNAFMVNSASPLANGSYTIIQQTSGTITSSGTFTVAGTAIGSGYTGSISVSGGSVILTVGSAAASPVFSGLTASQSITYGAPSVVLSGTLSAPGPLYPALGEIVSVTINGVIKTTTINDSTGDFSINYNSGSLPYSVTAYTITYGYGGNGTLGSANDTSTTVTVNQRSIVLTGTRVYDGTATAAAGILSVANTVNGDALTLLGSVTLADAAIGLENITSFAGLTVGGSPAGNYTLTGASGSVGITASSKTWNPSGNASGPLDGSGAWLAGGMWWNGYANVNGTWTGTSPDAAILGAGTAGNYTVTLASPVSAATATFNTSGYTVAGNTLTVTAASGSPGIIVSNGVNAQIASTLSDQNGWDISLGTNSVLTLSGTVLANGSGSPRLLGGSPSVSTVDITNGVYTEGGTFGVNGVTLNVTGSGVVNAGSRVDIGRTAAATVNVGNGGVFIANTAVNNDANASLQISRGQPAILNVLSGGLVSTTNNGVYPGGNLLIVPDSGSQGTLNVQPGAVLNVGTGATGVPGTNSATLGYIGLLGGNNSTAGMNFSASASAIANILGGTVTASGIQFGSSGGVYTANPVAQLNVNGGALYLGMNGISIGTNVSGFNSPLISVSGGIVGAVTNWSSSMPINLTNIGGNITFQAADVANKPWNITLSGNLTGWGGLAKTGPGTLTLGGVNTYSGVTVVTNGTLSLGAAGSIAGTPLICVGTGATFDVSHAASFNLGSSQTLSNSAATTGVVNGSLNASAGTVSLSYAAGTPALSIANGTLALSPSTVFNVDNTGSALTPGSYLIISAGTAGLVAGPLPAVAVTDGGVAAGATASLAISGGGLYLLVQSPTSTGLTLAAGSNPSIYGNSLTFQATVSPTPADGETVTFLDGATTIGTGMTAGGVATLAISTLTAVSHSITAVYAGDASNGSSTSGALLQVVNPATLALTAPSAGSISYGQTLASSTLSGGSALDINGLPVAGGFAFASPTTAPSVGNPSEPVIFVPLDTVDYVAAPIGVTVAVTKATPLLTVPSATPITFGQTLASSSLSGGTALDVNGLPVAGGFAFANPATAPSAGSPSESVVFTPTDTTDYNPALIGVAVMVNKATPALTAPSGTAISYGQTLASSSLSGGTALDINGAPVGGGFAFTTPSIAPLAGSTNVSVTFTPTDATDYNLATATVAVTVNSAALTITAADTNVVYGQTVVFAGTEFTTAGLINGDSVTNVTLYSDGATNTATAGSYTITATGALGAGVANYAITYVDGTLTVGKATPVLTAPLATTINYGQTVASSSLSGGAATNANTSAPVEGGFAFTTPAIAPLAGSTNVSVTFSPTDTVDYNPATATVAVAVNQAPLTVTALNATAVYGQTVNFAGTEFTTAGLINGDTVTNVTLYSDGATNIATVGGYAITAANAMGTGVANYAITYVDGTLTVGKATPALTAPLATPINYGQTLASSSLSEGAATNANSGVPVAGGFAFTTPTATPSAGTANVSVTFSPADTTDYAPATAIVAVTVEKAAPAVGIVSTENPSGFGDSVAFIATLPADATGSVVFSSPAGFFSTNNLSGGSGTSLAITSLPRGTNHITVVYSGDVNYAGNSGTVDQVVTNHPPVANTLTVTRVAGADLKIALSNLATNWSDADGDTVSLVSANLSTNGVTVVSDTANVLYSNPNNVSDQFSYTIVDSQGATAVGVVNIVVGPVQSALSAVGNGDGSMTLSFTGIANFTYVVQATTNLAQPVWVNVSTNVAGANGVWQFTDVNATNHPAQYYRATYNP